MEITICIASADCCTGWEGKNRYMGEKGGGGGGGEVTERKRKTKGRKEDNNNNKVILRTAFPQLKRFGLH